MFGLGKIKKLETENKILASRLQMTGVEQKARRITGNSYQDYAQGVDAIRSKYQGLAEWGSLHTGLIAEFRGSVLAGGGIDLVEEKSGTKGDAENEMNFLREYFTRLGFYGDQLATKTLVSELEGKLLYRLKWDPKIEWVDDKGKKKTGMVVGKHISYADKKYNVTYTDVDDITSVYWKPKASFSKDNQSTETERVILKPEEFVYRPTGAVGNDPNVAPARIHRVLSLLDNLDKALRYWHEIDKLFASPTPLFRLPDGTTQAQSDAIAAWIADRKWTIGSSLVVGCDYSLVGADATGAANLEKQIMMICRMVSGITGVPPHFLGMPDLMSNRSTADSLTELVAATTSRESAMWRSALKELAVKAIAIYNKQAKVQQLADDKVDVIIKPFGADEMKKLITVWMPLHERGTLSKQFILSKTPGVDVEDELQRQEEESQAGMPEIFKGVDNE